MDVPVAVEVESVPTNLCTNQRKRRTNYAPAIAKKKSNSDIKKKGQSLLTVDEQRRVSDIDMTKIMDCVCSRVEKEMFGELFPKRLQLWDHMKSCPDQLYNLVNYSVNEYLKLYKTCASVAAKDSELFLRWLDVMRSFTCEEKQTDVTRTMIQQVCGIPGFNETQGSTVAIVLNAVHWGISQQMASSLEKISSSHNEDAQPTEEKPSDDIAMHRICGWALKSASDHLKARIKDAEQKKPANPQLLNSIKKQFEFATSLKLPNSDKHLLPKPVNYLDRGGLTFLKPSLWSWMNSVELKIVENLNQKCYRMYGDKLFHVAHTALVSDRTLFNEFVTGVAIESIASVEAAADDIVETLYIEHY